MKRSKLLAWFKSKHQKRSASSGFSIAYSITGNGVLRVRGRDIAKSDSFKKQLTALKEHH